MRPSARAVFGSTSRGSDDPRANCPQQRRRSRALLAVVAALIAIPVVMSTVSAAGTEVVKPSGMNGWGFLAENTVGTQAGSLVNGPGTAPLGNGSARLLVNATNEGLLLAKPTYLGTQLDDITSLSYSTYRSSADAGNNLAASIQLGWDEDSTANPAFRGRLVFEPYFANPAGVLEDTWQTWDALTASDGWWTTMSGATLCIQSNPCSWTEVLAAYPNAEIDEGIFGFIGFKIGSGVTFDGNVDNFVFGTTADTTTYDFDPEVACTTTCYVNDATGDDANGGDTPTTAKKTIQAGVDAVNAGGTVSVAAGTYLAPVNVNKSVALRGAQYGVDPNDGSWADTRTNAAAELTVQGAVNLSLQNDIDVDGFTLERTATNEGHILIGSGNPTGTGPTSSFDIHNNRFIGTRTTGGPWAGSTRTS